jgi:hypothetical protein
MPDREDRDYEDDRRCPSSRSRSSRDDNDDRRSASSSRRGNGGGRGSQDEHGRCANALDGLASVT